MQDLTLLQLIGACFEKNELLDGWLHRCAPFADGDAAVERYRTWRADLERLLGPPARAEQGPGWQRAAWDEVRLKQSGRGVGLWLRPGAVWEWWQDPGTWRGDPTAGVVCWDEETVGWDPWDPAVVAELRGAAYARDGRRALQALASGLPATLQRAGAGVLAALAEGLPGAREVAAQVADALRDRGWAGDDELAEDLEAAAGTGPLPVRRPLAVDLDMLSSFLEGGMDLGRTWIDLRSGELVSELDDAWGDDARDAEGARLLEIDHLGSRGGYRDMEVFAATVDDVRLAAQLARALQGRGAFRRFRDVLDGHEALVDRWHTFSDERRIGRAREWLAEQGFRPLP